MNEIAVSNWDLTFLTPFAATMRVLLPEYTTEYRKTGSTGTVFNFVAKYLGW